MVATETRETETEESNLTTTSTCFEEGVRSVKSHSNKGPRGKRKNSVSRHTAESQEAIKVTQTNSVIAASTALVSEAVSKCVDESSTKVNAFISKKAAKKSKLDEMKAGHVSTVTSSEFDVPEQTQDVRAAAAWGEESESSHTVRNETSHTTKYAHLQAVRGGDSLMLAFDDLTCSAHVGKTSDGSTIAVRSVAGYADSGMMTAVIGRGRVGKATFLSALAGEEDQMMGKIFLQWLRSECSRAAPCHWLLLIWRRACCLAWEGHGA
ncbi:unnamed protein product [Phytophthora lilii]|uniref:Unnamed protein product n=1 Tax=Phytophthora lilii TaxID=2077276 RepID=A0A9W6XBV9_9STRA|nr:unnamed protein product [Phytophthora lilii]